ncbi:hypothetical protein [Chryseobacterium sp. SG20098]|uniref:hypothetical protein n=1 Tax=Chryseobacterium sp. SG20098 TaxID=3074145 RepID=UPI0028830CF6|nr:hypothetical protein [Chryseobacterium sp. SG20098]WNI34686.1 hypothetical protein RHP76_11885 [Chryseobacterium sp. SG20098]
MEKQRNNNGQFAKGNSEGNRFSSDNQPENNGRKSKSVTEFLKEYGDSNEVTFEITVVKDGKKKVQKGSIKSAASINQLIAITITKNAIQGDNKAITTFLDRTEGKVAQKVNHGGQEDNPIEIKNQVTVFELPNNNRD